MISFGLWITYLLIILAVMAAVIFPLIHLLKNPGAARGTLIGLGILVVIFIISLLLSAGQANEKYQITANQSKIIGAGLTMIYMLGIGAILMAVYTEVKKVFGK